MMEKSSPEYLRTSLAAAITLGLKPGKFFREARLYCLNLLLAYPEGCKATCTYCGLARANDTTESFIRVDWPAYPTGLVIEKANESKKLERACISTVTILKRLKSGTRLPVSILSNPTTTSEDGVKELRDAGADRFTVAIDLATESLFEKHRGAEVNGPHKWDKYWKTLEHASGVFGEGRTGVHLIAGMGETEREMAVAIQKVSDLGGSTHLFSFYPETGSSMESAMPCPPSQFRKVQMIRYLIDKGLSSFDRMCFDNEDHLTDTGVGQEEYEMIIDSGKPFETCGCPGKDDKETACNRPFGDGPPSDIKSYPFPLKPHDVKRVRLQLNEKANTTVISEIEKLVGIGLDKDVWEMARKAGALADDNRQVGFYLPSFKKHTTSEMSNLCSGKSFPAVSLTGKNCQLQCDHCRGKLLETMIPAITPEELLKTAKTAVENGAEGILLSGGSDSENRIPFELFFPAIAEIKFKYNLTIAAHTGLIDAKTAKGLESAGVDTVMMDIIGADKTIGEVYHLNKTVDDFEESLANLCTTQMKVAPHIVLGLHYGRFLGEERALEIVASHDTASLVIVVAMPHYAADPAMFPSPSSQTVGEFLSRCRECLKDREIMLGCARPGGLHRSQTDLYAMAAGIDSIAFPADGSLAAALKLGIETKINYSCCSMAAAGGVYK